MNRMLGALVVALAVAAGAWQHVSAEGAERASLSGRWTLNRPASQFPSELGFGTDLFGGGSGRARISDTVTDEAAPVGLSRFRESELDARRRDVLVDEVRNPTRHLTITEGPTSVTIADDRGRTRTFHPDGREELQTLVGQLQVSSISRWDADKLEIRYRVEDRRELRYVLWVVPGATPRLTVQAQFVERGNGDTVTRIYEPTRPDEKPELVPPPPMAPAQGLPALKGAGAPAGSFRASDLDQQGQQGQQPPQQQGKPGLPALAPEIATGPDAGLKGLRKLGVVVEDLGAQEKACGLKQPALEAAVTKSLAGAGLSVARSNGDEDTYLYVHTTAATASTGFCVTRYDVFLYTHTTAVLSYQSGPALVQVSLFHKGGLTGGPPAGQAEAVVKAVKEYTDEIAGRIRDANK